MVFTLCKGEEDMKGMKEMKGMSESADVQGNEKPPPPKTSTSASRDMVAILTHRVLAMAIEELRSEETRRSVNNNLVMPLVKAVIVEIMPYAIALMSVVVAILLMSGLTLALSVLFYLRNVL